MLTHWLDGKQIEKLSLHMCIGGGNRGDKGPQKVTGNNVDQFLQRFEVHPFDSFAYKLGSVCGDSVKEITARTGRVDGDMSGLGPVTQTPQGPKLKEVWDVERLVDGRFHNARWDADKIFFKTTGGTADAPSNPKMAFNVAAKVAAKA